MITYSPVSLSRRHVLGDLYARCEHLAQQIPVYLGGETRTVLGHCDESLGEFRDAFSFHLADDVCKLLSAGHYTYSIDYEHTADRLSLVSITLTGRPAYKKPLPKTQKPTDDEIPAV